MKRYAFYLLIMAVAAVAACQKQNDINTTETKDGSYVYTVNASIDNTESKSDYDADGKFSWTEGDAISVLFHNGGGDRQPDPESALLFLAPGLIRPVEPVEHLLALLPGQRFRHGVGHP